MQYLYHPDALCSTIELIGDSHRYIFKVRRHREGETIYLRNLKDTNLYEYAIESMDKKRATLRLLSFRDHVLSAKKDLHIGWCVIDIKSIEKVLPTLNEIGVSRITFIYCDRSQKQFKIDFERLNKIILNSSQQCGRSSMMKFDTADNLKLFKYANPRAYQLNFSKETLDSHAKIGTIVIGCEGGFSSDERALFSSEETIGLDTSLILRSESAACAVASRLLL